MNVCSVCVLFAVASEVPPAIQFWGGGKETETPAPPLCLDSTLLCCIYVCLTHTGNIEELFMQRNN